jgi:hypothetical protein
VSPGVGFKAFARSFQDHSLSLKEQYAGKRQVDCLTGRRECLAAPAMEIG